MDHTSRKLVKCIILVCGDRICVYWSFSYYARELKVIGFNLLVFIVKWSLSISFPCIFCALLLGWIQKHVFKQLFFLIFTLSFHLGANRNSTILFIYLFLAIKPMNKPWFSDVCIHGTGNGGSSTFSNC